MEVDRTKIGFLQRLQGYLKILWLGFWVALATLVLAMPAVILSRIRTKRNLGDDVCTLWSRILLAVTGVKTRAQGCEKILPGQSYIVIANHQSHFDILALQVELPLLVRWIIKKELRKIPVFGFAVDAMQNIFIDRSDPKKAAQSIQEGIKRFPSGIGILFFAEGTRSPDGKIGAFKKGGFRTAQLTGFPILPVVVKGSRRVLPKGEFVFRSGTIELVVLDPVKVPAGLPEDKFLEFIEATRNRMVSVFEGHPDLG